MRDMDELFDALEESDYRCRVRLSPREHAYLLQKTLPVILDHARGFIVERLAGAEPRNDTRQTPRKRPTKRNPACAATGAVRSQTDN